MWLTRRFVTGIAPRHAVLIALLPLVFTGKAMLLGRLYGPSDLYAALDPWKRLAAEQGIGAPRNPILSDLAFANLPWRAAVREALANGRLPFWNRFVLGGTPLLAAAQAGILHPSTWLGLWLPLPLSWTFSCTFTLFLALLSGFVFFRDFGLGARASLVGAVGWGFSTYVVFWNGWSVGPSTATLPLLLLGLRRIVREPNRAAIGLTAAALWLSLCGGHPETVFHVCAAGGVYFLWELFPHRGRRPARALGAACGAGALAVLLAGPQLFPLLEAIPHSAEYGARRAALQHGRGSQSVPLSEAVPRLLPDILPFAHGIYGKSVVARPDDGSGMPLGYAGAVLFPLALCAFRARPALPRGRAVFVGFLVVGVAFGASLPGLLDLTSRLPGFALALNYRLVFLAGLGLSGLAAFGADAVERTGGSAALGRASVACAGVLFVAFFFALHVFRERELDPRFVWAQLAGELVPLLLLSAVCIVRPTGARLAGAAVVLLIAQRFLEMRGTYPTLAAATLAPRLPTLAALPLGSEPSRMVAAGRVFRPNGAAFYGIEDVRGYESLILDRFAETYPLWSSPQTASFNRVDDLGRPFLAFLNARYAIGAPEEPAPPGWREQARGPELAVFENPLALPRAFVARRLRRRTDPERRLAEMAAARDFSETAWISGGGAEEEGNGEATLGVRAAGPDLVIAAHVSARAFVATSLPDWPGWVAEEGGQTLPIQTVNHAFVGLWLDPGEHTVRLRYRPPSWPLALAAFAAGIAIAFALGRTGRSRAS